MQSDGGKALLLRLWWPLILGLGVGGLFWNRWGAVWIAAPLLLWMVFLMSLSKVEAQPGGLQLRSFFRWKTIRYEEIRECGIAFGPLIGFLKLNRLVFPWGRVYFVLDGSLYTNPLRNPDSALLSYITERVDSPVDSRRAMSSSKPQIRVTCAAGAAGVVVSLILLYLIPERSQIYFHNPDWPGWVVFLDRARSSILRSPWNNLVFAALILAFALNQNRQKTWVLAFVLGLMLPTVVLGWL